MAPEITPRILKLAGTCCVLGLIWLVILPIVAQTTEFQEYKSFLDERNINPEAMYYSDLNSMPDILNRLEQTR